MNTSIEERDGPAEAQATPIRTLVVDDSPAARESIRRLLANRREIEIVGFAADGETGVCWAKALCPDLILMDLVMPALNGTEAVPLIRTFLPRVRVIMVTAHEGAEFRRACAASGADGFVAKDRLTQDLYSEMARVCGKKTNGHIKESDI
jgi:DNA-binding NarL/FixJ family response regulator